MVKIKKKRGFTLVELIVVLVILAILAALLVPALTGYIDKAKRTQVIAETRMLTQALQTEINTLYAKPDWQNYMPSTVVNKSVVAAKSSGSDIDGSATQRYANIIALSEVPSLQDGSGQFGAYISPSGRVAFVMYYNGADYVGMYFAQTKEFVGLPTSEAPSYADYLLNEQVRVSNAFKDISNPAVYFSRDELMQLITGNVS